MHQRKLIRDAIVQKIIDQNTAAGTRVYGNRIEQIFPEELPLILVYTRDERASVYDVSPLLYQRDLRIGIEIAASSATDIDDTLDAVAEAVEYALNQDHTLGGLCKDVLLQETDVTISGDGEKPIGVLRLVYEVTYFTEGVADSSALPDALTIEAQMTLAESAPVASQTINLRG